MSAASAALTTMSRILRMDGFLSCDLFERSVDRLSDSLAGGAEDSLKNYLKDRIQ